ncbi:hypothetical protein TNCV_4714611 [Trichonephila clavipes]|nr:hypothetical protein TNCV_4714611 [Trichonephila clavipes]
MNRVSTFSLPMRSSHQGKENSVIPVRKKFQTTTSAGKVLLTVFWDAQGVLLQDFGRLGPSTLRSTVTPYRDQKRRFGKK